MDFNLIFPQTNSKTRTHIFGHPYFWCWYFVQNCVSKTLVITVIFTTQVVPRTKQPCLAFPEFHYRPEHAFERTSAKNSSRFCLKPRELLWLPRNIIQVHLLHRVMATRSQMGSSPSSTISSRTNSSSTEGEREKEKKSQLAGIYLCIDCFLNTRRGSSRAFINISGENGCGVSVLRFRGRSWEELRICELVITLNRLLLRMFVSTRPLLEVNQTPGLLTRYVSWPGDR